MCGRPARTARGGTGRKALFRAFLFGHRRVSQGKGRAAGLRHALNIRLFARAVWLTILAIAVRLAAYRLLLNLRIGLRLLSLLRLDRCQDAEIVFRVLEIAFGHDPVALRIRIARELEIFLIDMRSGTADFDLGAVRIVCAVRVQIPAVAVATAAVTAAVAAV